MANKNIIANPTKRQIALATTITTTCNAGTVKHVSPSGVSRIIGVHDAFSSFTQFGNVMAASDLDASTYQTDGEWDNTKASKAWDDYRAMYRVANDLQMENGQVITRIGKARWKCQRGVVTSVVRSATIETPATKDDALAYVKDVANKNGIKIG